jgi:hypothetical protein
LRDDELAALLADGRDFSRGRRVLAMLRTPLAFVFDDFNGLDSLSWTREWPVGLGWIPRAELILHNPRYQRKFELPEITRSIG